MIIKYNKLHVETRMSADRKNTCMNVWTNDSKYTFVITKYLYDGTILKRENSKSFVATIGHVRNSITMGETPSWIDARLGMTVDMVPEDIEEVIWLTDAVKKAWSAWFFNEWDKFISDSPVKWICHGGPIE